MTTTPTFGSPTNTMSSPENTPDSEQQRMWKQLATNIQHTAVILEPVTSGVSATPSSEIVGQTATQIADTSTVPIQAVSDNTTSSLLVPPQGKIPCFIFGEITHAVDLVHFNIHDMDEKFRGRLNFLLSYSLMDRQFGPESGLILKPLFDLLQSASRSHLPIHSQLQKVRTQLLGPANLDNTAVRLHRATLKAMKRADGLPLEITKAKEWEATGIAQLARVNTTFKSILDKFLPIDLHESIRLKSAMDGICGTANRAISDYRIAGLESFSYTQEVSSNVKPIFEQLLTAAQNTFNGWYNLILTVAIADAMTLTLPFQERVQNVDNMAEVLNNPPPTDQRLCDQLKTIVQESVAMEIHKALNKQRPNSKDKRQSNYRPQRGSTGIGQRSTGGQNLKEHQSPRPLRTGRQGQPRQARSRNGSGTPRSERAPTNNYGEQRGSRRVSFGRSSPSAPRSQRSNTPSQPVNSTSTLPRRSFRREREPSWRRVQNSSREQVESGSRTSNNRGTNASGKRPSPYTSGRPRSGSQFTQRGIRNGFRPRRS
jgi:hypothetical protein